MILNTKIAAVILCLLLIALGTSGESRDFIIPLKKLNGKKYISYYNLIKKTSVNSSYDLFLRRAKIYYKHHMAVIIEDYAVALVDGKIVRALDPVKRHKGEIFIPAELGFYILSAFFGEVQEKNGAYHVAIKARSVPPVKKDKSSYYIPDRFDPISFVVIDPGHGGRDPGAIGYKKMKEKQIILSLSRYLERELKGRLKNIRIYMTRKSDKFIELSQRADYANRRLRKGKNGLFISIHANASISKRISGFETYFLSQNPSNDEARNTAALENNVIVLEKGKGKSFSDIDYIEASMLTTQIQRESSLLAKAIQKGIDGQVKRFKSRGVKKADFFVLRGSLMPAVLVEVGYVTNRKEAIYLRKSSHQRKIARGIAIGVKDFIRTYNKLFQSK